MRRGVVALCRVGVCGAGSARRRLRGVVSLPLRVTAPLACTMGARRRMHTTHVAHEQAHDAAAAATASSCDADFVDVDELLASAWSSTEQQQQQPLGVVRRDDDDGDEAVERSRLALPVAQPRRGRALPRAGSRRSRGNSYNDNSCDDNNGNNDKSDTSLATTSDASDGDAPPRVDAALAYDDERFAEMLLRMEVDGVIDEVWQDAARAHVEDVRELASVLRALHVRDVCCIDVSSKTSSFDYIVLGTCEGARHIHLAAWAVQEADTRHRIAKVPRRHSDDQWEVVTVGRIVVNLMAESLREAMTLERKWAVTSNMDALAAANAPVSEGRQVRAHGLWSLTLNLQDLADFEVDYCKDTLLQQL